MHRSARLSVVSIALALCGLGCPADQVPLGDAVVQINLDECFGTSCEGSDVVPRVLEAPDELECEVDEGLVGSIGWTVESVFDGAQGVVGPDDSLWIASSRQGIPDLPPSEIAIQRVDADGVETWVFDATQGTDHDFRSLEVTSMVIDTRGHGFVAVAGFVADRADGWAAVPVSWLLEIDPEGELVGEPIEIDGAGGLKLAIAQDGSLLLSAASYVDKRAVVGRLDADRTVAWVQTAMRQARIYNIASDDQGGALVYGLSAAEEVFEFDGSLALYDANGNLLWDVDPGNEYGHVVLDPDGNVIGAGELPDQPFDAVSSDLYVFKLSVAGETQWSVRLADSFLTPELNFMNHTGTSGFDAEGNIHLNGRDAENGPLTLYRVAADGSSCTKAHVDVLASIGVSGSERIANLIFAPSGKIYFALPTVGEAPIIFGVLER